MCVSALRDEPEMPTDDDSSDVAAASAAIPKDPNLNKLCRSNDARRPY